jgi:hypothetical protein
VTRSHTRVLRCDGCRVLLCVAEIVEHACSSPTILMGETVENVATNTDTYSYRQVLLPATCNASDCPHELQVPAVCVWLYAAAGSMCWHHAVQFPGHDPPVDVSVGQRVWQHVRVEAKRA